LVFVANPKAASTSIEALLADYEERPDISDIARPGFFTRRHAPAVVMRDELGAGLWGRCLTFAVMREPMDWVVSQVAYNAVRLDVRVAHDRQLGVEDVRWCHTLLRAARGQEASESGTQWAFLCDEFGSPVVDTIVRQCDIDEVVPALCRSVGITAGPLPKLNRTAHPPAKDWLSDAARREAMALYGADIDLYRSLSVLPR
jgi:hypothetical protein